MAIVNYVASEAAYCICHGFEWAKTPEGASFWRDVVARLEQIGNDGVIKPGWIIYRGMDVVNQIRDLHDRQKITNNARKAADYLGSAFAWGQSDEGDDFWREVRDRLIEEAR